MCVPVREKEQCTAAIAFRVAKVGSILAGRFTLTDQLFSRIVKINLVPWID